MSRGIVIVGGPDAAIEGAAKRAGLGVSLSETIPETLPYASTLLVEAGTRVPWDLLPAAWQFLTRWDAAIPLWRYGTTAAEIGSPAERAATAAVVRDLRVLLHGVELLFARQQGAGGQLVARWRQEMDDYDDRRLAFLRAVYQIKPRLCVLPASWLARSTPRSPASRPARRRHSTGPLVMVELEPGRFVKCHAGDEARVRAQFRRQREA